MAKNSLINLLQSKQVVMADTLPDTQIGQIIDAFNTVDTDNDGVIQSSQLGNVLKLLGENPTDADLQVSFVYF